MSDTSCNVVLNRKMDSILNRITKDWLVADECDPVEGGHLDGLKSSESTMPSASCEALREGECASIEEYRETAAKELDSKNNSSSPRDTGSSSPFEIEPGHYDFLQVAETYSSKKISSDPGLGKGSSTMDDSSYSLRRYSNQSASTSSLVENPKLLQFISDWIEQPSVGSTKPMTKAANNQLLGRGGFGPVYMGILPSNKQVAVKILDDDSCQGDLEFLNEVDLLSRVHHVNLVKLVGYCQEGSCRVLVYEHAENGTLWDHIHGNWGFLDWRTRLKVSLESACGLEYLHTGCAPRIIHRDIKSSNILLTKNFIAKVADFGLSKIGLEDENENRTHISTVVKGTIGYLDPEYYKTAQLNEKSDIYSFGVVLLEIVTGRNPIERKADMKFIGDWVKTQWKSNGPKGVVDSKLGGAYNPKSMRAVVTLALKCLETSAKSRPDVRIVVEQLRAAIVLEDNTLQASKWSLRSLLGQT